MSGGIGQAVSRRDGPAKVTGAALYAADTPSAGAVHAVIVPATRPKARITAIELGRASAAPGVIAIFTHENAPRFGKVTVVLAEDSLPPLQGDRVLYEGQPVALVVAGTPEQATEAARLVRVSYDDEPFEADFLADPERAEPVAEFFGLPLDTAWGDVAAAWGEADARTEAVYVTADRHHNPIEPGAILAVWQDGQLTVHDATQGVAEERDALAQALGLDPAQVRVRNDFIGGSFGAKLWGLPHQLLAAMAARQLERPVKLVLTRAQTYTAWGYQSATRQTVALSARADGTPDRPPSRRRRCGLPYRPLHRGGGLGHARALRQRRASRSAIAAGAWTAPAPRPCARPSAASASVAGRDRHGRARRPTRHGPAGAPAQELRRGLSGRRPAVLVQAAAGSAMRRGHGGSAGRAGRRRHARMRDGRDLVGWGMATAVLRAFRFPATARIGIGRDGRVLVETATHDVGQGLSTILRQIAADTLGVAVERVDLAIADTTLPKTTFTGGSSTSMSVGSAVQAAATTLREKLIETGANGPEGYAGALARLGVERLSADGEWAPDEGEATPPIFSFGAVFAEVRVDRDIPIPRVSRVVGVYDAGRILNPKTARSQMTGGIIWGIGQALLERSEMDPRLGRFLSKNLAGNLVPVNADVRARSTSPSSRRPTRMPARSVRGASASSAPSASARRSPTPCSTPPACACASCRSGRSI